MVMKLLIFVFIVGVLFWLAFKSQEKRSSRDFWKRILDAADWGQVRDLLSIEGFRLDISEEGDDTVIQLWDRHDNLIYTGIGPKGSPREIFIGFKNFILQNLY